MFQKLFLRIVELLRPSRTVASEEVVLAPWKCSVEESTRIPPNPHPVPKSETLTPWTDEEDGCEESEPVGPLPRPPHAE